MPASMTTQLGSTRAAIANLGAVFNPPTFDATHALYLDEQAANNASCTPVKVVPDIAYGPHARHRMDIYVPDDSHPGPRPVVVYVPGGGMVSGDKRQTEVAWSCAGKFFARAGAVAVVVNYRLVPDVTYPGGGDDIRLVRKWVAEHAAEEAYRGDPDWLVVVGQSAGGTHVATDLYSPAPDGSLAPPAGVAFLSAPFFFDCAAPHRAGVLKSYYGTNEPDEVLPLSPVGLVSNLSPSATVLDPAKVKLLILLAEYDTPEISDSNVQFFDAVRRKTGRNPNFVVLEGHNHVSNIFSLGTADERQAKILLDFVAAARPKRG